MPAPKDPEKRELWLERKSKFREGHNGKVNSNREYWTKYFRKRYL